MAAKHSRNVDDIGDGRPDTGSGTSGMAADVEGRTRRPETTGFRRYLRYFSLSEIINGLRLTLDQLFSPPVTRRYPEEEREAFAGSRALHALVRNPDTGEALCVGCCLCAAMCPSDCIDIHTSEGSGHEKVVDGFEIDTLRCLFCGLCVEACPYGAIVMTEHFAYSDYSRDSFRYTKNRLLENWDRIFGGARGDAYRRRFWRPKRADFDRQQQADSLDEDAR